MTRAPTGTLAPGRSADRARALSLAVARASGALVLVLGLVVGAGASPAAADGGTVELSADGTTWSKDLVADLFSPHLVWVPGDVSTATLYVRTTCSQASGRADVTLGPDDARLVDVLDIRTRTDGGAWTGSLSPSFTVAAGQVARLDVEVAYDPGAGNDSQLRSVPLAVVVTVSCDDVAPGPTPTPTASAPTQTAPAQTPPAAAGPTATGPLSRLASTGAAVLGAVVVVLLLVIAGAGLLSLRPTVLPAALVNPRRLGRAGRLSPQPEVPDA